MSITTTSTQLGRATVSDTGSTAPGPGSRPAGRVGSGHWSRRLSPRSTGRGGQPPGVVEVGLQLWARATDRDRWLLRMLAEHRVLTTTQVTAAAFGSARVARARLQMLANHRAVVGLRPRGGPGSRPWHWALDEVGARMLVAEDGGDPGRLRWRREQALAVLAAGTLGHTVGANDLGVGLIAYARARPGARLLVWWGSRRVAEAVGDRVCPDGYLCWAEGGRRVEVFCEYDTGTEAHKVLFAKADRYAGLVEHTGIDLPVVFVFPSPAREATFRRAAAGCPARIVTTTRAYVQAVGSPAGPVWQPLAGAGPRRCLIDLAPPPGGRLSTSPPDPAWLGIPPAGALSDLAGGPAAPDPTPPVLAARGWAGR